MLSIEIVCVGKIRDNRLKELIGEYCLWLGGFCKVKIIELPKSISVAGVDIANSLKFDERNILKKLDLGSFKIALCVEGFELSSEEFAVKISKIVNLGFSRISFIIGGAFGLSEEIKKKSDFRMSFSKMTLPHKLVRLFLVEQIYRAINILNGGPYHK